MNQGHEWNFVSLLCYVILLTLVFPFSQLEFLRNYWANSRTKVSQVVENLIEYTEKFMEFDAVFPSSVGPSNPWITDDQNYWILNQPM